MVEPADAAHVQVRQDDAAAAVGKLIAERAIAVGVKEVVFDRGSYMYHGRVKALAEGAKDIPDAAARQAWAACSARWWP